MKAAPQATVFAMLSKKFLYPFPLNIVSISLTIGTCLLFYSIKKELILETDVEVLWGDCNSDVPAFQERFQEYKDLKRPVYDDDDDIDVSDYPEYEYCGTSEDVNDIGSSSDCPRHRESVQLVLHFPNDHGDDVLTRDFLLKHLQFNKDLVTSDRMVVTQPIYNTDSKKYENKQFHFKDVCSKITAPASLTGLGAVDIYDYLPCNRMTVLDCFEEGSFDFVKQSSLDGLLNILKVLDKPTWDLLVTYYGIKGYSHLPKISELSDDDIKATVSQGCRGWIPNAMEWPTPAIIGGLSVPEYENNDIRHSTSYHTQWAIGDSHAIATRHNIQRSEASEIVRKMKLMFNDVVSDSTLYPADTNVLYLRDKALLSLLDEVSEQNTPLIMKGLMLMSCFCLVSMASRIVLLPLLSLTGLCLVYLSLNTTYWVMATVGIEANVTTNSVLPFLAIGMGVDDMFVLLRTYQKFSLEKNNNSKNNDNDNSNNDNSNNDNSNGAGNRNSNIVTPDGFQCNNLNNNIITKTLTEVGRSMTMTSSANFLAFTAASIVPVKAVSTFCQSCSIVVVVNYVIVIFCFSPIVGIFERYCNRFEICKDVNSATVGSNDNSSSGSSDDNKWYHIPLKFQTSKCGKLTILLLKLALLLTAIVGVNKIEYGLEISDIAPASSPEYQFTKAFQTDYSFQVMQVRTGNIYANFGGRQQEMLDAIQEIGQNEYVLTTQDWYLPAAIRYINATDNVYRITSEGLIHEDDYTDALRWWVANDKLATAVMPDPYFNKCWLDETSRGACDNRRQVEGVVNFYLYNLWETSDYTKMIESMEKVLKKTGTNLNFYDKEYDRLTLFGDGTAFTFFEQYMTLDTYGIKVAAYASLGAWVVGVAASGFYCGTMMTLAIITMIFELLGFLGLAGLKMSALPMVTVLSCIGISVEFVGHICSSFSADGGSGNDRIKHVYSHVYLPVIDGSISTVLGVLMLGQSDFKFVRLYFFMPYVAVVGIGLFNGLLVLPVVLSLGWDTFDLGKRSVEEQALKSDDAQTTKEVEMGDVGVSDKGLVGGGGGASGSGGDAIIVKGEVSM
jgi:hypothetical protein